LSARASAADHAANQVLAAFIVRMGLAAIDELNGADFAGDAAQPFGVLK
jgi:hypothetical protein